MCDEYGINSSRRLVFKLHKIVHFRYIDCVVRTPRIMDGIEALVCQRITFDLHSQIKQVKKAFIYLRNSLDGIPAGEDEGIHSLMNPDTKQNADNAHSKKG